MPNKITTEITTIIRRFHKFNPRNILHTSSVAHDSSKVGTMIIIASLDMMLLFKLWSRLQNRYQTVRIKHNNEERHPISYCCTDLTNQCCQWFYTSTILLYCLIALNNNCLKIESKPFAQNDVLKSSQVL